MVATALTRQRSVFVLTAIAKLAGWRFRQMWRFLLLTWLGMLAMVILACAPPLFSRVAISADLRSVAANSPDGQNIIVNVDSLSPTGTQIQQIEQRLGQVLQQVIPGPYLHGAPRFVVQTPPFTAPASGNNPTGLVLDGYDPVQVAQHTTVVQGRLPQETNGKIIEIALTQSLARNLGVHVGSLMQESAPGAFGAQIWTLHVVGIVAPVSTSDPFWLADANPFGSLYGTASGGNAYNVLAQRETLRAKLAALQTSPGKDPTHLLWSYPFDVSHLDANNIPALSAQMSNLGFQVENTLSQIQGVAFASPGGTLFATLSNYGQQIFTLDIVITCLLLLTLAIILFLIGMMADILVERQAAIIATLRSRGATRLHVFGTFIAQGVVIGLIALLAGPFLTIVLVRGIAQTLLAPANVAALDVITTNPFAAALSVKWYALIAMAVALLVMLIAISRSAQLDIVALRREYAREQRVPLWRRYNLDLFVIVLIALGYIIYNYLWQSLTAAQAFDPTIYNALKVGGFVAPPLITAAVLMLFLRLFPFILRLVTRLATKRRGAPVVLAFAQMERASRPAARVIVLLALAIATSCFLLTLMATKQQRTTDAAAFAVGADFSGPLSPSDAFKTFDTLKTQYSSIRGVQTATIGYSDVVSNPIGDVHISAVDTGTYAQTAIWPLHDTEQGLTSLTAQLKAHRGDATAHNVVYALVDAALWQKLALSPGASFTFTMNQTGTLRIQFIALAEIHYIPGSYNSPINPDSDVGIIVDYQSYATVYAKNGGGSLSPNYVWLRTAGDAASLASVRSALPGLQDRQMLTTANQQNSVHVDILGVLAIGMGAALLLALLGTLLSSWLNAASRITGFAVLRALGMTPRQVAAVLLWEQCFVYLLGFLLGIGLGAILTLFAAPAVELLDLAGPSSAYNPFDVPPVPTVIPYSWLALLLSVLLIVCLVALLLMARIVSRPSPGQTLRLNED